jgi:thiopeptide-type bacteriocin biosynthesis protein
MESNLDDRVVECSFEPETERYGGTEILGHSLDFFCLSSAYALHQTERTPGMAKSRLLAQGMRALMRQALGFAASQEELLRLMAYTADGQWRGPSPLLDRADREFDRRSEEYARLVAEEINLFLELQRRSRLSATMLTDGALLLNQHTRNASGPIRSRILYSQLHMTWNRMGIFKPEEVYLGRILWLAIQHLSETEDNLNSLLTSAFAQSRIRCKGGFEALIPASLAQLARSSHTRGE